MSVVWTYIKAGSSFVGEGPSRQSLFSTTKKKSILNGQHYSAISRCHQMWKITYFTMSVSILITLSLGMDMSEVERFDNSTTLMIDSSIFPSWHDLNVSIRLIAIT